MRKMSNDLISVIVPIYNASNYLDSCLKGILNQSYRNIELILVDDGSTDDSLCICQNFGKLDHRIVVLHKSNGGVSSARNAGLQVAKGKYVTFIDPDDLVAPAYITCLYAAIIQMDAQIAVCKAFDCNEKESDGFREIYEKADTHCKQIVVSSEYDFFAEYAHYTVWGAMFLKNILEGVEFQTDLFVGEDSLFYVQALLCAEKIAYMNAKLYCYIKRPSSVTANVAYNDKKFTEVEAWRRICELTKPFGGRIYGSAMASLGIRSSYAIIRMRIFRGLEKERYQYCVRLCRELLLYVLRYGKTLQSKIGYIAISICPIIGVQLYRRRWIK